MRIANDAVGNIQFVWDGRKARTVERLSGPLERPDQYDAFVAHLPKERPFGAAPVGSDPGDASPFGVLDLHGNVGEWVDGPFDPYPGGVPSASKAFAIPGISVVRGVGWSDRDYAAPASARSPYLATTRSDSIGFRCARGLPPPR